MVQLDVMSADDQLSGHVYVLERDGYSAGCCDTMSAGEFCAELADNGRAEGGCDEYLWPGYIVSAVSKSLFGSGLTLELSCTISSIARLVYTVNIEQANVDESFAANFGSTQTYPPFFTPH